MFTTLMIIETLWILLPVYEYSVNLLEMLGIRQTYKLQINYFAFIDLSFWYKQKVCSFFSKGFSTHVPIKGPNLGELHWYDVNYGSNLWLNN